MHVTGTRAFALAILAHAAGFLGWRHYETVQLEHRLGAIASSIAGRPCASTARARSARPST